VRGQTALHALAGSRWGSLLDIAGLSLLAYLFADRLDLGLLLTDTMLTGGDGASWYQSVVFLRDTLLPAGRLFGWDQGNFFGYPNFQYYFVPPFLLAVLLNAVMPLTAALKIVSFSGVLLTPFVLYCSLRLLGYERPLPLIGAWVSLVFLFHERFNMFGGNVLSTLAGEFCYGIAFALQVLFMGFLYRGMTGRRHLVLNAALLALIGLTHAFVFPTAVLMPLYFLFSRRDFAARFAYLFWLYLLAFLFMAFWALPMVLQYEYSTPIQMIWRFYSLQGLLEALSYEVLLAAALLGALVLALHCRGPHLGLFAFMIAVSGLLYLVATTLKIADIRFFPPLLFFSLMLILDCASGLHRASGRYRGMAAVSLLGLALIAGGLWAYDPTHEAPDWFEWNYSGYETKPAFRDGTVGGLAEALRAPPGAPRVAWEKTSYDRELGSDRVFESIPLLFGRLSTEGIHYASALLSKTITWMHGEYSLTTASPQGLINPHYSLAAVPARFRAFNIGTILVRTPEMTQLFEGSADFSLQARVGGFSLFRTAEAPPGYISTPRFQPVPVSIEGGDWHRAFLLAFRRGEGMDPPLIDVRRIQGSGHMDRFAASKARLDEYGRLSESERLPVPQAKIGGTEIGDFSIRFRTGSPGLPHLVRVAYSPNWRSRGGEPIYLVSPGLMLLFPEAENVELVYRRHWSECLGAALSLLGLVSALGLWRSPQTRARLLEAQWLSRLAGIAWRLRLPAGLALLALLSAAAYQAVQTKQRVFADYFVGNRLAAAGRTEQALAAYRRAGSQENVRRLDHPDVPNAIFALARLYRSMGEEDAAEQELRRLTEYFPGWRYAHQVYLELGELLARRGAHEEAQSWFRRCAEMDRFSTAGKRCRTLSVVGREGAAHPAARAEAESASEPEIHHSQTWVSSTIIAETPSLP
jgi:hypothetical protein